MHGAYNVKFPGTVSLKGPVWLLSSIAEFLQHECEKGLEAQLWTVLLRNTAALQLI